MIDRFNADPAVDAYLCQYPFPPGFDYEAALLRGRPGQGRRRPPPGEPRQAGHGHRRPAAVHARTASSGLLVHYDVPIAGRHVVIVGRGLTIGRPLANLLSLKRPTPTPRSPSSTPGWPTSASSPARPTSWWPRPARRG